MKDVQAQSAASGRHSSRKGALHDEPGAVSSRVSLPAHRPGLPHGKPKSFFLGLKTALDGIEGLIRRNISELESRSIRASGKARTRMERMRGAFEQMLIGAPMDFYQALQYTHFFNAIDGFDNAGRIDQYLGPFYLRDLAAGRVDAGTAEDWFLEIFDIWARNDFWNISIGGQDATGAGSSNALTFIVLNARKRLRSCKPSLSVRIPLGQSEKLLAHSFEALKTGLGQPALYNDDLYVRRLKQIGVSSEDAPEYSFGGCTETHIAGKSAIRDAFLNLAAALQLLLEGKTVLFDAGRLAIGTCDITALATWDSFLSAYKRQVESVIDCLVYHRNLGQRIVAQLQPAVIRSIFISNCIDKGMSHSEGGAEYNHGMVSVYGVPNIANSLFAIKKLVYESRSIALSELVSALRANFQGHEALRQQCLRLHKYGNDFADVDECARQVSDHVFTCIQTHTLWNGGIYYGFVANGGLVHIAYGEQIGATPDGRLAGKPLANSMAPVPGTDTNGPTATINSVTKLDLSQAIGTPVVNLAFSANLFSPEYLTQFTALVQTFFRQGGMQLQINVIDNAELRRALDDPESHGNLLVRVSGYCARFVDLPRTAQMEILERTVF